MNKVARILTATAAAMAAVSACAPSDPLVVRTKDGLVKGIEEEGTMAFLGIPYAKVERFMPPLPVDKWDTVMVCDHFGPMARYTGLSDETLLRWSRRDVPCYRHAGQG